MFQKRKIAPFVYRKPLVPLESSTNESDDNTDEVKIFKKRLINRKTDMNTKDVSSKSTSSIYTDSVLLDRNEVSSEKDYQRATSTYDIDTDKSIDHRSTLERNVEIGKKILSGELEENVYRGRGAYRPIMNIREGSIAASKYTGLYGPIRASSTNVRTTLRVDYQPDVCKDYKETGYCGFGDTCKFLHDRSDYKSGWQIENEWEEQQAKKRLKMQEKLDKWQRKMQSTLNKETIETNTDNSYSEEESECDSDSTDSSCDDTEVDTPIAKMIKSKAKRMEIPFSCLSCKKVWNPDMNPVVTSCGHYFCEPCSISAYSKNMKCAKCGTIQDGILNKATNIQNLLDSVHKMDLNRL